jgi:molybdate transport system substrate-binding protein
MLKVMGARAPQEAIKHITTEFTRKGGPEVAFDWGPMGVVRKKIAEGVVADLLIVTTTAIPELETAGVFVPGSREDLGSTSIGVAVRAGAKHPDISTPAAFEQTLRAANSIALSDLSVGGTAGTYLRALFEKMGISEEITRKARWATGGGDAAQKVASGEAEMAMTFISEILPVKGTSVAGPLPPPIGSSTTYAIAIASGSTQKDAARDLIRALTNPDTREIWKAAGFDWPGSDA